MIPEFRVIWGKGRFKQEVVINHIPERLWRAMVVWLEAELAHLRSPAGRRTMGAWAVYLAVFGTLALLAGCFYYDPGFWNRPGVGLQAWAVGSLWTVLAGLAASLRFEGMLRRRKWKDEAPAPPPESWTVQQLQQKFALTKVDLLRFGAVLGPQGQILTETQEQRDKLAEAVRKAQEARGLPPGPALDILRLRAGSVHVHNRKEQWRSVPGAVYEVGIVERVHKDGRYFDVRLESPARGLLEHIPAPGASHGLERKPQVGDRVVINVQDRFCPHIEGLPDSRGSGAGCPGQEGYY